MSLGRESPSPPFVTFGGDDSSRLFEQLGGAATILSLRFVKLTALV